jgi:FMN phosphatase YigB (HAD superfamily)
MTSRRPTIAALLLDFGGTLDAPGTHWSTQLAHAVEAAGLRVERGVLDGSFLAVDRGLTTEPELVSLGLEGHVRLMVSRVLSGLGLDPAGVEPVVGRFVARARGELARSRTLLAALRVERPALRLGLVSNFTRNLRVLLGEEGLAPLFDAVLCSEEVGLAKPDPALFRLALERLSAEPEEAAMVGDSLGSDIVPAKALGLRTVWIRGDRIFGRGGDERTADAVARSLEEALPLCFGDELRPARASGGAS